MTSVHLIVSWRSLKLWLLLTSLLGCCLVSPASVSDLNTYQQGRYDRRVNVFSPGGELLQVNYADIAASRGELVVAVLCSKNQSVLVCKETQGKAICYLCAVPERVVVVQSASTNIDTPFYQMIRTHTTFSSLYLHG